MRRDGRGGLRRGKEREEERVGEGGEGGRGRRGRDGGRRRGWEREEREGWREEERVGEGGEGGMEGGGEGVRGREPVFKTASLTTQIVINKGKMNLWMFEYYM